jgi:small GTP-binding protein
MYDYLFKVIILGDSSVGKSSICTRFSENKYNNNYDMTIGVEFSSKIINIENKKIKLQIWDTAGQEQFRSMIQSYYRNTSGAIICFDITNKKSFESVKYWIDELNKQSNKAEIILVGTKADLEKKRVIDKKDAINFAAIYNIYYIEVSSLKNDNIIELFNNLATSIYKKILLNPDLVRDKAYETGIKRYVNYNNVIREESKKNSCCGFFNI